MVAVGGVRFLQQQELRNERNITTDIYIGLPVILGYIVWLLQQQKKDRDANSKGTMLLLLRAVNEYHSKYMKEREIPSYAYDNFSEMYDAYHALGGNGIDYKNV